MASKVEIKQLCKSFGPLKAVDDVSFTVEQGEVLGFLGPNGAGKSTTMKMVTGFLSPTSGTAVICGHDVVQDPLGVKRVVGYLPEGAPSYPEMTPLRFLRFIGEVRGLGGAALTDAIDRAVAATSLQTVIEQRFETLSKGFKRRVGLAQSILHDPDVLILDEPTDGLDPNQKHEVRKLIREMGRDKVIILSTHILEEVEAVCTRAIVIAQGRKLEDGTPTELMARSSLHNAVTVELVGVDAAVVVQTLGNLPFVSTVEELSAPEQGNDAAPAATGAGADGVTRYRIRGTDGADVLGAIAESVSEAGWSLRELHRETGRLDEVFRQITLGSGSVS